MRSLEGPEAGLLRLVEVSDACLGRAGFIPAMHVAGMKPALPVVRSITHLCKARQKRFLHCL